MLSRSPKECNQEKLVELSLRNVWSLICLFDATLKNIPIEQAVMEHEGG